MDFLASRARQQLGLRADRRSRRCLSEFHLVGANGCVSLICPLGSSRPRQTTASPVELAGPDAGLPPARYAGPEPSVFPLGARLIGSLRAQGKRMRRRRAAVVAIGAAATGLFSASAPTAHAQATADIH